MPAHVDVFKLIKDNATVGRHEKPSRLQPFVFYTDGGVDNDSYCYFMDKLFMADSMYCYASRSVDPTKGGVHVQAYLGRQAMHGNDVQPYNYRKDPNDNMIL